MKITHHQNSMKSIYFQVQVIFVGWTFLLASISFSLPALKPWSSGGGRIDPNIDIKTKLVSNRTLILAWWYRYQRFRFGPVYIAEVSLCRWRRDGAALWTHSQKSVTKIFFVPKVSSFFFLTKGFRDCFNCIFFTTWFCNEGKKCFVFVLHFLNTHCTWKKNWFPTLSVFYLLCIDKIEQLPFLSKNKIQKRSLKG